MSNILTDLSPADAVSEMMDHEMLHEHSAAVSALVQSIADKDLRRTLDNAIGAYIAAMLDEAFAAGWKAGKNPDSLIFREGDPQ